MRVFLLLVVLLGGLVPALANAQDSEIRPVAGWWWNTGEPGRGFAIEVQGDQLFIGAYLYDDTGEPTWYVSVMGRQSNGVYTGSLLQFEGGQSLNGNWLDPGNPSVDAGSATLTFTANNIATLDWPGGTVPLQPFPISQEGEIAADFTPETGWWWTDGERGRGFGIEVEGSELFLGGYMYDQGGKPIWYVAIGPMTDSRTFTGQLLEFEGGQSLTGAFRTATQRDGPGGFTLRFESPTSATMTLDSGRVIPLTRFIFASAPVFDGLVEAVGNAPYQASLRWLPAVDDQTAASQLTYEVHASRSPGFTPSPDTLLATVTGTTSAGIFVLENAVAHEAAVVAIDGEGNRSETGRRLSFETQARDVALQAGADLETSEALGLGSATISGNNLSFPAGGTLPQAGAFLIGPSSDGEGYLRRVTAVSGNSVTAEPASIDDFAEDFELTSRITLFDVAAIAQAAPLNGGPARGVDGIERSRSLHPDGTEVTRVAFADGGLIAEQETPATAEPLAGDPFFFRPSFRFEPELQTDLALNGLAVTRGRVVAAGTLDAQFNVGMGVAGALEFERTKRLFRRTFRQVYVVGTVPVYQRITLSVDAVIEASAGAQIEGGVNVSISERVSVGVVYNPQTGSWDPVLTRDTERSAQPFLDISGTAAIEARLEPRIEVAFYGFAGAGLSVSPFVGGTLRVGNTGLASPAEFAMTDFTLQAGLRCEADIFAQLLFKTFPVIEDIQVCPSLQVPFFTLPQFEVAFEAPGNAELLPLAASITDGINNPFKSASGRWTVHGDAGNEIFDNGLSADLDIEPGETVQVSYSGYGAIGEIARSWGGSTLRPVLSANDLQLAGTLLSTEPESGATCRFAISLAGPVSLDQPNRVSIALTGEALLTQENDPLDAVECSDADLAASFTVPLSEQGGGIWRGTTTINVLIYSVDVEVELDRSLGRYQPAEAVVTLRQTRPDSAGFENDGSQTGQTTLPFSVTAEPAGNGLTAAPSGRSFSRANPDLMGSPDPIR